MHFVIAWHEVIHFAKSSDAIGIFWRVAVPTAHHFHLLGRLNNLQNVDVCHKDTALHLFPKFASGYPRQAWQGLCFDEGNDRANVWGVENCSDKVCDVIK